MCVLSGCDYLPSLPGIGLAKACKFFQLTTNTDVYNVRWGLWCLSCTLETHITCVSSFIFLIIYTNVFTFVRISLMMHFNCNRSFNCVSITSKQLQSFIFFLYPVFDTQLVHKIPVPCSPNQMVRCILRRIGIDDLSVTIDRLIGSIIIAFYS